MEGSPKAEEAARRQEPPNSRAIPGRRSWGADTQILCGFKLSRVIDVYSYMQKDEEHE